MTAAPEELRLDPDGTAEVLARIFAAAGGSADEARAIAVVGSPGTELEFAL